MVFSDGSRRRCTASCRFVSRDPAVAVVDAQGVIRAVGRGPTTVDVLTELEGGCLRLALSVYVLSLRVIPDVKVTATGLPWKNWNDHIHSVHCLEAGVGLDSPDLTARLRANSYGYGLLALAPGGEQVSVRFDFGRVCALDEMWVWNYNCPDDYRVLWWNGGTAQGMRDVTIVYSVCGKHWEELQTEGHPFRLAKATGTGQMAPGNLDDGYHSPVRFHGVNARYVNIIPNPVVGTGNWGGECFGLAQVRFSRCPGDPGS